MRRIAAAASALTVLAACQPATVELTEELKAEIVAEVSAVIDDYTEAWSAADLEKGMSFTLNSPEVLWVGAGRITRGYAEQEAMLGQTVWSNTASVVYTSTDQQFTVLAPDVVTLSSVGTMAFTNVEGVTNEWDFTYTYIWVLRDGEWKILIGHGP